MPDVWMAEDTAAAWAGSNTCTTNVGTFLNNTDYADGSGPRVAKNAADCCNQRTSSELPDRRARSSAQLPFLGKWPLK